MAVKVWQAIKVQHCRHAGGKVALEAQVLYPEEHLPDLSPRVMAHRCSNGVKCNTMSECACVWSGTNPAYDPFAEKQA